MDDHGGKVWAEDGRRLPVLDFSASLWPATALARTAFQREVIEAYPDPDCRGLERAAAGWYGVEENCVFATNGSTEALYLLMRALAPQALTLFEPTFSEYARAAAWGLAPQVPEVARRMAVAGDGFRPRLEAPPAGGMAVLCNPNNPTGVLLRRSELERWLDGCAAAGAWVLIDEAFLEFVEDAEEATVIPWLRRFPRLLVLRSLTKCLGVAGLRLGFLLAQAEVIARVRAQRIPWSVNGPAQRFGQMVLESGEAARGLATLAQVTARERSWLTVRLERLGWTVYASAANFLLCRLPEGESARELLVRLRQQGVLLRDASTFVGLEAGYLRCAVRPRGDNRRLVQALEACR